MLLGMIFLNVELNAQNLNIKGKVIDPDGIALAGVAVVVKGSTAGAVTNDDGDYSLPNVPVESILEYRLVGYVTQEIKVAAGKTAINVILLEDSESLEEVTVVAFGTQKKESVIASVSTINTKELKVPSSNLTTAFAGRIAGLISYQRTGEPGQDNAEFFIRGVTTFGTGRVNPLILIDGVEMTTDDLARLTTDDIKSFSIMKDANATALYGARGANGVILVTTKEGTEGKMKIQFRAEGSYSSPTQTLDFADPVTYMKLHNESILTRDPLRGREYSPEKIAATERLLNAGQTDVRYPAVDWQNMLFNDYTFNHRYNLSLSGGGAIARYYVAASYARDNGIIKMDRRNNFNNNIQIDKYVLRSNININPTKTTEIVVRLHGAFDDYRGPLDGGAELYKKAMNANPVYFQPYYEPDYANRGTKHILFGNYNGGLTAHLNPYAEMVKGYKSNDRTNMLAQFEVKQDLGFFLEGLSARAMFNVNRYSLLELTQSYIPYFYQLLNSDDPSDYKLQALNDASGLFGGLSNGRESLELGATDKRQTNSMYVEAAVNYNRTFADKHDVSGLLVYTLRESVDGSPGDLQASLPGRNLGLAGRVTYGYDSRYFIEANFGYNGSERFSENERFGFFPSAGLGWIVSNEEFMEPWSKVLTKLKLKATYGLVGNDDIGDSKIRFFYLSKVNLQDADRLYWFGYNRHYSPGFGVSISRYADPNITWEISRKTNLGFEMNLWNSLELQVDWFMENRSNIMMERADIPTTMGLQAKPSANIGKAYGRGIDMSLDYSKSFTQDIWAMFRGNFTYAASRYEVFEEPDYSDIPWRSRQGQKIKQEYGFVAERLFLDEYEVKNSPRQFGDYMAGDIKYKDINKDGVINDDDMVPLGYPTTPEINYGFGISAGYKNFDISCFFQGSARSSFWIDPERVSPFINRSGEKVDESLHPFTTNRALLQYWADSHWSEQNRDIHALWPRLSYYPIENNMKRSTWFMHDGSFLRLKSVEIGYSLPKKWIERFNMRNLRIYANGTNLFIISAFKMWDPEMAGDGLKYPLQKVFNLGVNIDF
ncbi:MAG: TonB-dependent receptor [Prevotellaceae bacterium]|nr:TonB-dependent receptor [Prevotellaceae bacterium]